MERSKIRLRYPDFSRGNDVLAVANMEFELHRELKGEFNLPTSLMGIYYDFAEHPHKMARKPQIILADMCSGAAGFAMYSLRDGEALLGSLYTRRAFRGFGVGERMLGAIIRDLRQKEAREIHTASSLNAKDFYRKFGFVDDERQGLRNGMVLALNL